MLDSLLLWQKWQLRAARERKTNCGKSGSLCVPCILSFGIMHHQHLHHRHHHGNTDAIFFLRRFFVFLVRLAFWDSHMSLSAFDKRGPRLQRICRPYMGRRCDTTTHINIEYARRLVRTLAASTFAAKLRSAATAEQFACTENLFKYFLDRFYVALVRKYCREFPETHSSPAAAQQQRSGATTRRCKNVVKLLSSFWRNAL